MTICILMKKSADSYNRFAEIAQIQFPDSLLSLEVDTPQIIQHVHP